MAIWAREKKLTAESGHAARRQDNLSHSFPFLSCQLSSRCSDKAILLPPSTAQWNWARNDTWGLWMWSILQGEISGWRNQAVWITADDSSNLSSHILYRLQMVLGGCRAFQCYHVGPLLPWIVYPCLCMLLGGFLAWFLSFFTVGRPPPSSL